MLKLIAGLLYKASATFGRLREKVWDRTGIRAGLDTKLKVYQAIVLPTLLYGCETWTDYQLNAKKLNRFHLNCLRKLLKIKWQVKIPATEVLARADMMSLHTLLMKYIPAKMDWSCDQNARHASS